MTVRLNMAKYKAVFFDAGDTLITIPEAARIFQKFLAERSLRADESRVAQSLQEALAKLYHEKEADGEAVCSPETDRRFWTGLYRYVFARLGVDQQLDEEKIHAFTHELYDIYNDPEIYVLFDDVEDTLAILAERGYRLGLVSNFASSLRTILEAKGIACYFDPMVISTEVGLEKPNPAIFRLALDKAGLAAREVLYVGDHDVNDILAPASVGMDAVKIMRYSCRRGEGIHSLRELIR